MPIFGCVYYGKSRGAIKLTTELKMPSYTKLQVPLRAAVALSCAFVSVCCLLVGSITPANGLVLAPYDADPECSASVNTTARPSSSTDVVVLLDSHAYLSLDRLWYADDESIDLFTFPVAADPIAWELVDETECGNVWQYCGDSTTDILLTQFISRGELPGTELFIGIELNFFRDSVPGVALLSCPENSENALIVEADDTYAVYSEIIPCGEGSIVNSSGGLQHRYYEFNFIPRDDFELVLRANLSDSTCVNISRVRVFHHFCPNTTVNYVYYPQTVGGMYAGACVPNAVPIEGPNITAFCTLQGEWTFPLNLTTNDHCLCGPGYVPDNLGIECIPCPNGTYKSDASSDLCIPCPENSHTTGNGSSICRCNDAYIRSDPSDVTSSCEACAQNFYHMDGTCNPCPAPGSMDSIGVLLEQCRCLNGTANLNTSYAEEYNSTMNSTCEFCAQNYYRSSNSDSCLLCPLNSFREPNIYLEDICNCTLGSLTADGLRQTVGDPCIGCDTTHFLYETECRRCPAFSSSMELSSTECECELNSVTPLGSTTTTDADCVCMDGLYRSTNGDCIPCPLNSRRDISVHDNLCPCDAGYARRPGSLTTEQCYGPIIGFGQQTLQVLEGSARHSAAVQIYSSFPIPESIVISLNITGAAALPDHLVFPRGETFVEYLVDIEGDETALETDEILQIRLTQSGGSGYIVGSGDTVGNQSYHSAVTITICEDDVVYIGFTQSNITSSVSAGYLELVLRISTTIGQDLAIQVVPNVTLSVFSLQNPILTFVPDGSLHLTVPVQLTETEFLVDAYYVGFTLELIEQEFLRDEVSVGGTAGLNEQLTMVLLPPQSKGLSQGAEIGLISFCVAVVIVVLALIVVLVFCFCRHKLRNQSGCNKKRSFSSLEDDQDIDDKAGMAMAEVKVKN